LRRTDKAVAVIAQECGFATLSHFNRQFRLRHGATPREFRASG
jgi:AraC-like DNA-binding protein